MLKKTCTAVTVFFFFFHMSVMPALAYAPAPAAGSGTCMTSQEIRTLKARIALRQAACAGLSQEEIYVEILNLADQCRDLIHQNPGDAQQSAALLDLMQDVLDRTAAAAQAAAADNASISLDFGSPLVALNFLVSLAATIAVYGVASSPCVAMIQLHDLSGISLWLIIQAMQGRDFGEALLMVLFVLTPAVAVFGLTLLDYPVCALEGADKLVAALASDLALWLAALEPDESET